MKAIKALILSLALLLPSGVTAGEITFNRDDKIIGFYIMPDEKLPKGIFEQFCTPGWSYEVYRWTSTEGGSFTPNDIQQGRCPKAEIKPPINLNDKIGI